MLRYFAKKNETPLDKLIDDTLSQMENIGPDADEYADLLGTLETLYKLRKEDRPNRVDRNTVLQAAASVGSILLIIAYEQKHIFNTRAAPHIPKVKTPNIET